MIFDFLYVYVFKESFVYYLSKSLVYIKADQQEKLKVKLKVELRQSLDHCLTLPTLLDCTSQIVPIFCAFQHMLEIDGPVRFFSQSSVPADQIVWQTGLRKGSQLR